MTLALSPHSPELPPALLTMSGLKQLRLWTARAPEVLRLAEVVSHRLPVVTRLELQVAKFEVCPYFCGAKKAVVCKDLFDKLCREAGELFPNVRVTVHVSECKDNTIHDFAPWHY